MAVYRVYLGEGADALESARFNSDRTRLMFYSALRERNKTAFSANYPMRDIYIAMSIPPLDAEDIAFIQGKVGAPMEFQEITTGGMA